MNDPKINKWFQQGERAANGLKYWRDITLQATKKAYYLPILMLDGLEYENPKTVKGDIIGPLGGRAYPLVDELKPAK